MNFEYVASRKPDIARIYNDFKWLLTPSEIGVHDEIESGLIVNMKRLKQGQSATVSVFRTYLPPDDDGVQLVLSQHLSRMIAPVMGETAFLHPFGSTLFRNEAVIASKGFDRLSALRGDL